MNLEEFITETLKQMIDGVIDAQTYAEGKGAKVNIGPLGPARDGFVTIVNDDWPVAQIVEFDVALTSVDSDKAKGGIGIFVAAVGIGAQGETQAINSAVSRIKFSIPIRLPGQ